MALSAFLAGMLFMLASTILLLPWLRSRPGLEPALARRRWPAALALVVLAAASLAAGHWLTERASRASAAPGPLLDPSLREALAGVAQTPVSGAGSAQGPGRPAGSMSDAVASLESRLARGGGSDGDWELLAKSYEFLGRSQDAALARSHRLPPTAQSGAAGAPSEASRTPPASAQAAPSRSLSADSLKRLATAGRLRRERHFKEAAAIYASLAAADQLDADGWADYADTAASLAGRKLAGAPESYVQRALALDPNHPKALWLEASAQEEQGRLADAVLTWQRLAGVLPKDSDDARIVAANLARDTALLPAASAGAAAGAATGVPERSVSGEVSLAPALKGQSVAGATLFIVAKSVDEPGPPLAVIRRPAGEWPVKFTLDDTQAMLPGHTLSGAGRIEVEARVSRSGQALPTRGDLRGKSAILGPADRGAVRIIIDEVVS